MLAISSKILDQAKASVLIGNFFIICKVVLYLASNIKMSISTEVRATGHGGGIQDFVNGLIWPKLCGANLVGYSH